MQVLKYILTALYLVHSLVLIILIMRQNKDDKGASGTIVGSSSTDNFYEKNKSRTREGKLKRLTMIFMIIFFVFTIILGTVYML